MKKLNYIQLAAALIILATFFLPWLNWKGADLSGNAMPAGQFFSLAKEKFGVGNPFPQFSIVLKIFWLIPVLAALVMVLLFIGKDNFWPAAGTGLLSLSLVLVYFLFSKSIVDQLGVTHSVWALTKPWLFLQAAAAVAIVLTAGEGRWLLKSGLVLGTAVMTVAGFTIASKQAEKKLFGEKFETTDNIKADYSFPVADLLKEFTSNDTSANKKYAEKVLEVKGAVSAVELSADSSGTVKFEDSTGSFAIFSVEKSQYDKMKSIKAGDMVTVKGVCSGSIFSDILGTTQVSFKRSVLNKQ